MFARHTGLILSRAYPDAVAERCRREAMHDEGRRGGIADSHLAKRNDVGSVADFVDRELAAARQGLVGFVPRHRRLACGIGRAHADLGVDQRGVRRQLRGDAGIDDPDGDIGRRSKCVGAGAAGQIGGHHRRRYLGGILRHAFLRQAVVAGEYQQHGLLGAGLAGMPDHAELHGEILDFAQ